MAFRGSQKLKEEYTKSTSQKEKRRLRNTYVGELRKAKKEHNKNEMDKNKKKGIWGILNKKHNGPIKELEVEGTRITDKKEMV